MNSNSVSRQRSRNHRGARSLVTIAARLPDWARSLWQTFRVLDSPRELRRAITSLRELLTLLEARLEEMDAQNSDQQNPRSLFRCGSPSQLRLLRYLRMRSVGFLLAGVAMPLHAPEPGEPLEGKHG